MKSDETGRVSVAFPGKVIKALKQAKETTKISYSGFVVLAVEAKLRKDGFLRK